MVERPCLDPDEPTEIANRVFLAVHPEVKSNEAFDLVCSNYLVKDSGETELFLKPFRKYFNLVNEATLGK